MTLTQSNSQNRGNEKKPTGGPFAFRKITQQIYNRISGRRTKKQPHHHVVEDNGDSIPDDNTWMLLRQTYKRVMVETGGKFYYKVKTGNGFKVPFEVRQSPGKGRGVFVTEFVPKGTRVWKWTHSVEFKTEEQWRKFLSYLPHHLAQSCILWAYVMENDDKERVVGLELDEAALMNHGGPLHPDDPEEEEGTGVDNVNICSDDDVDGYIATRDLLAGEEILCDYHEFHEYENEFDWFTATEEEYDVYSDSSSSDDE